MGGWGRDGSRRRERGTGLEGMKGRQRRRGGGAVVGRSCCGGGGRGAEVRVEWILRTMGWSGSQ